MLTPPFFSALQLAKSNDNSHLTIPLHSYLEAHTPKELRTPLKVCQKFPRNNNTTFYVNCQAFPTVVQDKDMKKTFRSLYPLASLTKR